jgi:hypothetical protein
MENNYFDIYGNVLPQPVHIQKQSENPSTFNAALYFSMQYKGKCWLNFFDKAFKAKYLTNGNQWRTMENDNNPRWSHDEKISTLAYFNYTEQKSWIKKIPLVSMPWNNSSWLSDLRPDVFAYTLAIKYPCTYKLKFIRALIWYKIGDSLEDFVRDPVNESSGAQKAFIMMMGLNKQEKVKAFDEIIKLKRVFDNYYPNWIDHPTRRAWNDE